jgi:pterin-4a-carbinolamine dehydratase
MANVTVSVGSDLKEKMDHHPEINWSEVARQAIEQKIEDLEVMDEISSMSELTEEDIAEISEKINRYTKNKRS